VSSRVGRGRHRKDREGGKGNGVGQDRGRCWAGAEVEEAKCQGWGLDFRGLGGLG
jgi:hypothetical protein